ncbi:hypothetical protein Tco_0675628 [Tanacetum coccineum]
MNRCDGSWAIVMSINIKTNWLDKKPVKHWYQSHGSDQGRRPMPIDQEEVTSRIKEIEAFNASKESKEHGEDSRTQKEMRARCYKCKTRRHVYWKCPNKEDKKGKQKEVLRPVFKKMAEKIKDGLGTTVSTWDVLFTAAWSLNGCRFVEDGMNGKVADPFGMEELKWIRNMCFLPLIFSISGTETAAATCMTWLPRQFSSRGTAWIASTKDMIIDIRFLFSTSESSLSGNHFIPTF